MTIFSSFLRLMILAICVFAPSALHANELNIGGDVIAGATRVSLTDTAHNDVFAMGETVQISGDVAGDVHAIANNLNISGDVGADVYAAGNNVVVSGAVTQDASLMGHYVEVAGAGIAGNARIAGTSVVIDAPIAGSTFVAAQTAELGAVVAGDLMFHGPEITFSEGAQIAGNLILHTQNQFDIPASVISADRITYQEPTALQSASEVGAIAQENATSWIKGTLAKLGFLLSLFVLGIGAIALFPVRTRLGLSGFAAHPFKTMLDGLLSLSVFAGIGFVLIFTLIGIPLAPFGFAALAFMSFLGFAFGAYLLAHRAAQAFGQEPQSLGGAALVLAVGLAAIWVLGMIPFVGWTVKMLVVFAGLGAFVPVRFSSAR